mgnify:CR=1 FL=1
MHTSLSTDAFGFGVRVAQVGGEDDGLVLEEVEADHFAANFLVPEPEIEKLRAQLEQANHEQIALRERLTTPPIDVGSPLTVTLEFDHWFRQYGGEICDVDVRSSLTGGEWVNVGSWSGGSTSNPQHEAIDISAQGWRAVIDTNLNEDDVKAIRKKLKHS